MNIGSKTRSSTAHYFVGDKESDPRQHVQKQPYGDTQIRPEFGINSILVYINLHIYGIIFIFYFLFELKSPLLLPEPSSVMQVV